MCDTTVTINYEDREQVETPPTATTRPTAGRTSGAPRPTRPPESSRRRQIARAHRRREQAPQQDQGRRTDFDPSASAPTRKQDLMSHPIPEHVTLLASRLRLFADELESAARFGVPVPKLVSVSGHEFGDVGFAATAAEFAAWADYTEATVEESDHHGHHWQSAEVEVNGLPLRFSCQGAALEPVTA